MVTDERTLITKARSGDADAFCQLYSQYSSRLYRYAFYRLGNGPDAEDAVSECVLSAWKQISGLREEGAFPAWIFRILSGCCARLIRQQIERRRQVSLDAENAEQISDTGDAFAGVYPAPSRSSASTSCSAAQPASESYSKSASYSAPQSGSESHSASASYSAAKPASESYSKSASYSAVQSASESYSTSTTQPAPVSSADPSTWLILQEALETLPQRDREILLLSAVGGLNSQEIAELTGLTAGSVRSNLSRSLKKVRGYLE